MIPVAFCLPPAAPDNRRLYAYLTHTRSIAHEIVNTFIDEHLIYQDKQGNIVFVCYDCFGRVKSAHKRGTNSAQRYRGFVTGGEFNCGFSYANDNATVLYVFEAPIDLMSFLNTASAYNRGTEQATYRLAGFQKILYADFSRSTNLFNVSLSALITI